MRCKLKPQWIEPMSTQKLTVIGSASGVGGNDPGSCMGPVILQESEIIKQLPFSLSWQAMLYAKDDANQLAAIPAIVDLCDQIAENTFQLVKNKQSVAIIGGDQSCSIGTWSGAADAVDGPLGLIWVDAHMDSHTPDTSPSENIHGMALACLLGQGDPQLTSIMSTKHKLAAENVCLIGIRSFEPEEAMLLKELNVRIFDMQEIQQRGLEAVFTEALTIVKKNTAAFGVSIDMDAIDPSQAPGVGVPEPNGLDAQALCAALRQVHNDTQFIASEIVEFNPNHDQEQKTETVIKNLLQAMYEK